MIKIARNKCAVLHLGLRSHWYRMIDSGVKKIEFREAKPYWTTRINNWIKRRTGGKIPVLEFQCGYGRFSPRMTFLAGDATTLTFQFRTARDPVEHKELGEFPKDRFVLFIGERVEIVDGEEGVAQ